MKKLFTLLFTLFSLSIYSQAHVGVSGAMDLENDISKLGVGVNYMILPKVTLGAGVMITPFDVDGDYEIMYNVKYNLGRFNVAAGIMTHEMGEMDHMEIQVWIQNHTLGLILNFLKTENSKFFIINQKR